jgi:hypothetical protein
MMNHDFGTGLGAINGRCLSTLQRLGFFKKAMESVRQDPPIFR